MIRINSFKFYFIYKTTNLINGKIYVGQRSTNKVEDGYLGSGKAFLLSVKKHCKENFTREILEFCDNDNINEREIFWIKELDSMNNLIGYNLCEGGCTNTGYKHTKESKILISQNHADFSGENHPMYKHVYSKETLLQMSLSRLGTHPTEETKLKQLLKRKGKKHLKPRSNEAKLLMKVKAENRERGKCIYCDFECDISNLGKYHNENCKQNPNYIDKRIDFKCDYCDYKTKNRSSITQFHNNNCKFKPKS